MQKILKILSALSDETRLRIYLLLTREKLCVCELVNILNMEQSRISHSLRILKEADLVNSRREGKWIIYSEKPTTNKIIEGLKKELKIPVKDLRNLNRCKKEKIREKCLLNLSARS